MYGVSSERDNEARKIDGHFPTPADGIVQKPFGRIAKIIWPDDTEAWIASLAKRDVRTARRWISGEIDAPAHVWAVMFAIATNPNRSVRER